jgi:predicted NUDIX family NTP pyrophosphohydrolase
MKETAGTLLYRLKKTKLEVLLVHASGSYNRKSPWSIPKGLPEKKESMEEAARRETFEETGVIAGRLRPLGHVNYTKSRKRVHCFFGLAPLGARPVCASWEVDRAEFISVRKAKKEIHQDQLEFLKRFELALKAFEKPA